MVRLLERVEHSSIDVVVGDRGHCSELPRQVAPRKGCILSRAVLGQLVKPRRAVALLVNQPDLVTSEKLLVGTAEQVRVMRVENELSTSWVRSLALEDTNELARELGVKACVDLVREKDTSVGERVDYRSHHAEPNQGSE
ncbi:MAG TPA: hypothetical protein VJM33_04015 [Microthrixaceae bacterium]|nr:hypothetical protein [Microthrixaceae bacterium]